MAENRVADATEAFVQLVLAATCRSAFADDSTFLSFPLNQYTFPKDNLKFGAGGNSSLPAMQTANELAHIANSIPHSVKFELDGDYLWTVYGDVLTRARLAAGTLTSQQKDEYAQAMELLYVETADGLRELSPKHRAYKQYRDAWIQAQNDLALARTAAEQASDPAKLKQWQEVDEPALRARIADRDADWSGLGFKTEIDAAKQVESAIASASPSSHWRIWSGNYNPDIDMATSAQVVEYAPTGFAPSDVFDFDNWKKVQLNRAECVAVAEQAPDDIKVRYSKPAPPPDLESVSFELRSVLVLRPWFEPKVLSARFWRLDDDAPPVSDGAIPSNARCPAYVQALIFGRNLSVTSRVPAAPKKPLPFFGLSATAIVQQRFLVAQKSALAVAPKSPATQPEIKRKTAIAQPLRPAPTVAQQQATALAMKRLSSESFSQATSIQAAKIPPPPAPVVTARVAAPRVRDHRARTKMVVTGAKTLPRPGAPSVKPAPSPVNPAPPATVPVTRGLPENSVSIVAFVCRPVPRSPDPDPAFNWS